MPLVVSHASREVCHVPNEDVLAEILGHCDFDGEDWAVGDTLIFEDGTTATIRLEEGEKFHVWTDNVPIELSDAIEQIVAYRTAARDVLAETEDWESLFRYFQEEPRTRLTQSESKSRDCLASVAFLAALIVLFSYSIWIKLVQIQ